MTAPQRAAPSGAIPGTSATVEPRIGMTMGIIGGGQLGRMSAMAAAQLGVDTHVYCTSDDDPGAQVATRVTVGALDDREALAAFAASCDVITYEFENLPWEPIAELGATVPVRPSPRLLQVAQDRIYEKGAIRDLGLPTVEYAQVRDGHELREAIDRLGVPAILKTARLGYDGKGQRRVSSVDEALVAFEALGSVPCVLEEVVDFACEVSVVVARDADGTTAAFDVTENEHRDHILSVSHAPARVDVPTAKAAITLAEQLARGLELVGIIGVEMFVQREGGLLVNEIAPRPHNTGHWTQDGCRVSQFEQHVHAVCGLPLGDPTRHANVTMHNLLGDEVGRWAGWLADDTARVHLYGKREVRPGRKMGHVNVLAPLEGLQTGRRKRRR